jgi:transcriptional regulator HilA, main transcriptional regulator of SPI1
MSGLVWRFAGFEYSSHGGLRKDGVQISVGPQARQLLELLLESKGAVVSKSEISERLWPGRPVSDDSIDRCAYLLRKPLKAAGFGDLIATAYGRGLSLRAVVETLDPSTGNGHSSQCAVNFGTFDLWQIAYELAGSFTRDGYVRAQAAVLAAGAQNESSPAVRALSANIAASRVTLGYLRPVDGMEIIERDARRALLLAPDFPPAVSILGWSRAMLSARLEEGLAMMDHAVAQDPLYSKARAHRCWALVALAELDGAIDDIEAALSVSPHDRSHLTMRAWLAFCAGDIDGSARLAEDGLQLRPDGAGLQSIIAIAASLADRHIEAESAVRQGLQRAPDNRIVQMALAYVLARAGREEEARAVLLEATGGDHAASPVNFLSAAQLALGDVGEASKTLRRGREDGCPWFAFAPFDPRLAALRTEMDFMTPKADAGG